MPVLCTLMGEPWKVPVKPSIPAPRSHTGPRVEEVSAM
jgi:hypothetical protein